MLGLARGKVHKERLTAFLATNRKLAVTARRLQVWLR